jgi:hypothetical protein
LQMDASMKAFDDAVALEPNRADAFVGKAHVYLALGQVSPVAFSCVYAHAHPHAHAHAHTHAPKPKPTHTHTHASNGQGNETVCGTH